MATSKRGVRVTERKIEMSENNAAKRFNTTSFFSFIKYAEIEKVITDAYPIAKALNNKPVGRSIIIFKPSRMLSCATGI